MATSSQSVVKDRIYKLLGAATPLSYVIASKDTKQMRLVWYDEVKNISRALRYATNQKSPFIDEQVGEILLDDIVFEDGFLMVSLTNPSLQTFLKYTPDNGRTFVEVDVSKDAEVEMEKLDMEANAIVAARGLSIDQMENMVRVLFGKDPSLMDSKVIQRDIKIYARQHPKEFLDKLEDPALTIQADVRLLFDRKLLAFRNHERDVHFNLRNNKTRMVSVPFGEDPYRIVQAYFETEEGAETLKMLEIEAENM